MIAPAYGRGSLSSMVMNGWLPARLLAIFGTPDVVGVRGHPNNPETQVPAERSPKVS